MLKKNFPKLIPVEIPIQLSFWNKNIPWTLKDFPGLVAAP